MCRTGSQVETEQQWVNEAMGEGGQSPAQRPGSYNPAQEPSMGYYTFNAWNTIYSHTNPPLAERLLI